MKKSIAIFAFLAVCAMLTYSIPTNKHGTVNKQTHEMVAKDVNQNHVAVAQVNEICFGSIIAYEAEASSVVEVHRMPTASKAIYAKTENERISIKPELKVNHSPPLFSGRTYTS